MEFRLLGAFEIWDGGQPVKIAGQKQRALLALLVLRANEAVRSDLLIDQLWGEQPPHNATAALHTHISRLRKTLGPDAIASREWGYELRVSPAEIDLQRFESLVAEAEPLPARERATKLAEALAMWRGPPLADLINESALTREIAWLEELRLSALERRIDADLEAGSSADLVGELEMLVAEHPLREHLRADLMLALYRCGRQADALEAYHEARSILVETRGLDPGSELRRLEQAILRQDKALDLPRVDPVQPPDDPSLRPRRRPRAVLLAFAALGLVCLVAGVAFATTRATPRRRITNDAVAAFDVRSGHFIADIAAGRTPVAVAAGNGAIWATGFDSASVSRINPAIDHVVDTIDVPPGPGGLAVGRGSVWVASTLDGSVSQVNPGTDQVVRRIPVAGSPTDLAVGFGAVWVTTPDTNSLTRIAATTGRATRSIPLDGLPTGVATAAGALWVAISSANAVVRVDPKTGATVDTIGVGGSPSDVVADSGSVWIANAGDGTVSRVAPSTDRVIATIMVGGRPNRLAVAPDGIWVTDEQGTVTRIDPRTNQIAGHMSIGTQLAGIAYAAGRLWITNQAAAPSHRGGTLRITAFNGPFHVDPARAWSSDEWEWEAVTGDGLLGFARVGGPDGARLVPDLAQALPQPTAGDTTYTFRLRPDIRYSDGESVEPGDFRHELERVFRINPTAAGTYYAALVGGQRCLATPKRCDLSRGVVADANNGTVSFHLAHPDPQFLDALALPFAFAVPPSAPNKLATKPLPETGPYRVTVFRANRALVLTRNRFFREHSPIAQPDGFPDRIVIRFQKDEARAVAAVEAGRLDLTSVGNAKRIARLRVAEPGRLYLDTAGGLSYATLNTTVAPFDNRAVRRAVNYAFPRTAAAHVDGGPWLAKPTCQILPPNLPGYRPYCPFTIKPASGAWNGPALTTARRLVRRSGTVGERVIVVDGFPTLVGPLLVRTLHRLGYRARLRVIHSVSRLARLVQNPSNRVQVWAGAGWTADYPDPSAIFTPLLSCASSRMQSTYNFGHFCDPAIDREAAIAARLETTSPVKADHEWEAVDRAVVNAAPWISYDTASTVDLVSRRVGNVRYHPEYQFLIDQMWVR